jgi:hypothetical protein
LSRRRQASVKSSSESTPSRIDNYLAPLNLPSQKKRNFHRKLHFRWRTFMPHKTAIQNTTFTTQNTTTSPPKNHHQNTTFLKTPSKNAAKTAKPRFSRGSTFFLETTS